MTTPRAKPTPMPRDWQYIPDPARSMIERIHRHGPAADLSDWTAKQVERARMICRRTTGGPIWTSTVVYHATGYTVMRHLCHNVIDRWASVRKATFDGRAGVGR
jgi:hypothetical protein